MKSFAIIALLASSVLAVPAALPGIDIANADTEDISLVLDPDVVNVTEEAMMLAARDADAGTLEARQSTGSTANELSGPCRAYTFIYARGSTESGNLGTLGGPVCDGLKRAYGSGNVACQGVGGSYRATLAGNSFPEGTPSAAYDEAIGLFNTAASRCPNTVIVAGGYRLASGVRNRTAGVVLFGSTRTRQENGRIPNYPAANVLNICKFGDGVCNGALLVTAVHLTYGVNVPEGVTFLRNRISAA
ncbi:hypothetical protein MBLNU230_g3695t1 [Neophaeotheca triangularis]